ncbi:MAG: putative toxin-antitoxin system toxin component, PIN family [Bacteroides sp.]|nr:putative toxin-antitoxin system toxin component, PIN family [Bacteroides sp.]
MSRIVLDTNSLVQCLPSRSRYRSIWDSFLNGDNELCVTTEILNEYEEILERLAGTEVAKLAINTILNNPKTLFCTPYYNFTIIQSDPDDNKFVDCAVVANAKFIVTEDHHFDVLKQCSFPKIDIVTLDEFMKQI